MNKHGVSNSICCTKCGAISPQTPTLTHIHTNSGMFYYPKLILGDKVQVIKSFDEYERICTELGETCCNRVKKLAKIYCRTWEEFGGIAIEMPPLNIP